METSPSICSANQWTGFYMVTTSVMKELSVTIRNEYSSNSRFIPQQSCITIFQQKCETSCSGLLRKQFLSLTTKIEGTRLLCHKQIIHKCKSYSNKNWDSYQTQNAAINLIYHKNKLIILTNPLQCHVCTCVLCSFTSFRFP